MIVVTGAAGFIGSHLMHELRSRGLSAAGLDRRTGVDHVGDLVDDVDILDVIHDADIVFHLAGRGGVRSASADGEAQWWRDNVRATDAVLRAMRPSSQLVVTSSSSVYGGSSGRPCREGDALRPRGGYARSKVEMERRCRVWSTRSGRRVAIARPFTVAGERQRPDMALAMWIAAALDGRPAPLYGSPAQRRDVTDVRQVARALADLAEAGASGVINLGTGAAHTLGQLLDAVRIAVGPLPIAHRAACLPGLTSST